MNKIPYFMKFLLLPIILWTSIWGIKAQDVDNLYETDMYKKRIAEFRENPIKENQIVFLGNSLTQGGEWNVYFPKANPINRGISGDNTDGMLARLKEIIDAKPQKVFLLAGINDISQNKTNKEILTNVKQIILRIQQGSPKTEIYVQSLLPINNTFKRYTRLIGKEKQVVAYNKLLSKKCKKLKVTFINLYPFFLNKEHLLDPNYTSDGLHLNDDGYLIWVKQLYPYLEK